MLRRSFNVLMLSAALAVGTIGAAMAQDPVRIGVSASKTGPLAGGASGVLWPNIKLWAEKVNKAGGLKVGDQMRPIEIVEYDDKSSPEEAVKNIQRLATQDQVDLIIPPYSTGLNLATAPLIAKYGYPQIVSTGNANDLDQFVKRWPNTFWLLGPAQGIADGIVGTLKDLRDAGKIGNRVAVVNVSDAFGLEMIKTGKPALKQAGFDIVYESSYPLGNQDVAPVIASAKAANPDAFVAYSYPPDSFALTEQAQLQKFNVKAFFVSVGGNLDAYGKRLGAAANGVLIMGGVNASDPVFQAYRKEHLEVTGQEADWWASPVAYASLEILQQAVEHVGSLDKEALNKEIQSGTFKTVIGDVHFDNNINNNNWTVGQWSDGVVHGVRATGNLQGAQQPVIKPVWPSN
ncbi:Branched-chain amino acid transporter substrate-binding protein [Mesorhizobium prunaredense]|uniref:Branched-chain amino acid transporter substrate-binding protein n=1 Tax=Mesorhizobium prunaredense TaxID=1631249 RepID=A0A1R3VAH9_9HYPH|nr:amino acid ABC transporter substrate-binding protein [Mesorhizobium prunaredense]SIT56926.1 Branched-chain amino acid transporter substrate-binding protein [Mesorhizobium prunaredense]